jgi:hypothetical protein
MIDVNISSVAGRRVVTRPRHMAINEILVRPAEQVR